MNTYIERRDDQIEVIRRAVCNRDKSVKKERQKLQDLTTMQLIKENQRKKVAFIH